ncbi:unnamed protein product, partial [Oppiella nova]
MLLAYAVRYHPKAYLGGPIGHVIIWFTTFSITLGHMYWQKDMIRPGFEYGPYEHYLYLFFHKPLYLSWFAWLIYGTSTGRWGFLNDIIGWKGFKVVDNMSLEIYIMHVFVFVYRIGVQRELRTYNEYYIWSSAIADFVSSYVLAVIAGFLVSRPFAAMTQALLKPQPKPKAVSNEETDKNS